MLRLRGRVQTAIPALSRSRHLRPLPTASIALSTAKFSSSMANTSKGKRKNSPEESEEEEERVVTKAPKKARGANAKAGGSSTKAKAKTFGNADDADSGFAKNGQPTNKVLPENIEFAPKAAGATRIATWNVSGLAAAQKKGFKFYVEAEDADILIITETKVNDEPMIPVLTERYPHRYWTAASKKGYAGVAVLSKHKPLSVTKDLPGHPDGDAVLGRIVTLEFEKLYLVCTYVTNAGQGLKTLSEKEEWNKHFEAYIRELDAKKPVIWGGDLNVAPTAKDLTHAKPNWNKTPGYTESETSAFARILNPSSPESSDAVSSNPEKLVDAWRHLHPDLEHYSYFGYRFNCRAKGIGWRLDMFVVSERLMESVKACEIRSEIYGASDHCPVILEVEGFE